MRPRDLTRLTASTYDVLVVGGGIYGLTIAYEAASRGLRTALVEARDFGSGASFNHQKTVHGGLRSLQSASLRRALESILDTIRDLYPDLDIENCSSGGSRLSLDMLQHSDVAWLDDQTDPSTRVRHNLEGLLGFFPPSYLLSRL